MLSNSVTAPPLADQPSAGPPLDSSRPGVVAQIIAAPRQLLAFCIREKRWTLCMAAFAAIWIVELYIVQKITLVYPNEVSRKFALIAPVVRLVLDTLFIVGLTLLLRRRLLCIVVPLVFLSNLILVTYHHYFQRPLSVLTLFGNWREGLEVGGFSPELFPKLALALLTLAMVLKFAALYLSRKASLPRNCAWVAGLSLAVVYGGLYLIANRVDPLNEIMTRRGVGRLGVIRGYLGPWWAEWHYLGDNRILEAAKQRRLNVYDRLVKAEGDIPIHKRLAVIQAESLDYNILGYEVDGVAVTPFLNSLRDASMFLRVRAMHANGSADTDFCLLSGVAGSEHVNTFLIAGYPFEQGTTPKLLAQCGFKTYSFHGNTGEFYNRRPAYAQMGLDETYFREELESKYGLQGTRWGIPDRDVLTASALDFRKATDPTFHFVITLTTHTPYTQLPASENEIFPNPRNTRERYINNMRYLDNCLRDYVTSLGAGTTVVIFADHPAEHDTITPDRDGVKEFIPFFIYDSDQRLSDLQRTRGQEIASDGTLNLVDAVTYLRAQITRNFPSPAGSSQTATPSSATDAQPADNSPASVDK